MNKEYVSTKELAQINQIDASTIKYYSDEGLLTYIKTTRSERGEKRYPLQENNLLLLRIQELKRKGYNIAMIKESFQLDYTGYKPDGNHFEKAIRNTVEKYYADIQPSFTRCIVRESEIRTRWNGVDQPLQIKVNLHINTTEGSIWITASFDKETKLGDALWLLLYKIGSKLDFNVLEESYTNIWDDAVKNAMSKEKQAVGDLIK